MILESKTFKQSEINPVSFLLQIQKEQNQQPHKNFSLW
jgi:hypothetical protein